MKKHIIILFSMLLLAGSIADAQINPIDHPKHKQKTEQTQKQNKTNNNSKKQRTNPQKQNSRTKTDKEKQSDHTTINISITSNASDGAVYIDGLYYGIVGSLYEISPGTHKLMIVANGYETHQSTIYVSPSSTSFKCQLNVITHLVTITCNVTYASLTIDGVSVGFANGKHTIPSGSHTLKISHPGYIEKTEYVSILSDCSYSFDLTPNQKSSNVSYLQQKTQNYQYKTVTVNGVTFEMAYVEGGSFMMGGTEEQGASTYSDAETVHQVTLYSFFIGTCEVTQELWKAVMGYNPSFFKVNPLCPVELVSWNDCQKFIVRLNSITGQSFRLPTEAEWEYAARGGNKSHNYKYAGGNSLDDVAWYCNNSNNITHPVGLKIPNELGLYDMSGNVGEWCHDWYDNDYYSKSPSVNPIGPNWGSNRIVRGGRWDYTREADYCVWARNSFSPMDGWKFIGLRLAATSL